MQLHSQLRTVTENYPPMIEHFPGPLCALTPVLNQGLTGKEAMLGSGRGGVKVFACGGHSALFPSAADQAAEIFCT